MVEGIYKWLREESLVRIFDFRFLKIYKTK